MTRAELVEKVARGIPGELYDANVEAAEWIVDTVLEEAASIADKEWGVPCPNDDGYEYGVRDAADKIATAIRALKSS